MDVLTKLCEGGFEMPKGITLVTDFNIHAVYVILAI